MNSSQILRNSISLQGRKEIYLFTYRISLRKGHQNFSWSTEEQSGWMNIGISQPWLMEATSLQTSKHSSTDLFSRWKEPGWTLERCIRSETTMTSTIESWLTTCWDMKRTIWTTIMIRTSIPGWFPMKTRTTWRKRSSLVKKAGRILIKISSIGWDKRLKISWHCRKPSREEITSLKANRLLKGIWIVSSRKWIVCRQARRRSFRQWRLSSSSRKL